MKPLEALLKAKAILLKPSPFGPHSWIQGHWALDSNRKDVKPENEHACVYCEEGAIRAATAYALEDGQMTSDKSLWQHCLNLINAANPTAQKAQYDSKLDHNARPNSVVYSYNDAVGARQFEEVIQRFDNAIDLLTEVPQLNNVTAKVISRDN